MFRANKVNKVNKVNKANKVNKVNKLKFYLITFLTISLTISLLLNNNMLYSYALDYPCKGILWGYVLSNGYAVKGYDIILQDVRTGRILDKRTTDDNGVYVFWLYKNHGGVYNISVDTKVMRSCNYNGATGTGSAIGGSVSLVENRAVRMDLDIAGTKFFETRNQQSVGYICYITSTGGCYHALGCQYLQESCIPMPYDYVVWAGYEPCKVCLPGMCKE
jgi:hypothetical protein